jgi:hypothetical protein
MTITIEQYHGVGIHAHYAIRQDGKLLATMDRGSSSRRPWTVYSTHYGESLGGLSHDINKAKTLALELTYPSAQEIYERICQRTENARRLWMQQRKANELAALAREMVAGSNSAPERIMELSREIEAYAKNRSDTRDSRKAKEGQPLYAVWDHGETAYPVTPDVEAAEKAARAEERRKWQERQKEFVP